MTPLAVGLVTVGGLDPALTVTAIVICTNTTSFTSTSAILVAGAAPDDRPWVYRGLLRWGLSMIVVGPLLMAGLVLVLG